MPPSKQQENSKKKKVDDIDDDDSDDQLLDSDDDDEWEDDEEECWVDDLDDGDDDDDDEDGDWNNEDAAQEKKKKSPSVDLYAVLGVSKQATQEEIAKAYRRQALQFHPDRNPEGGETFKKLTAAYEVLSDPQNRRRYDRTGAVDAQGDVDIDHVTRSQEISEMLQFFMDAFRYSDEEVEELAQSFTQGGGVLEKTLDNFMWTNDEGEMERIVELVNNEIINGKSGKYPQCNEEKLKSAWQKSATPAKVQALSKKLDKERKEAEEILRELLKMRNNTNNKKDGKKKEKNSSPLMMITSGKNSSSKTLVADQNSSRSAKNTNSTKKTGGELTLLPSLASLRENAKKNFFDMADDLEARYCGTKNASSSKKAKKETK